LRELLSVSVGCSSMSRVIAAALSSPLEVLGGVGMVEMKIDQL
jgi:hypothetical protein